MRLLIILYVVSAMEAALNTFPSYFLIFLSQRLCNFFHGEENFPLPARYVRMFVCVCVIFLFQWFLCSWVAAFSNFHAFSNYDFWVRFFFSSNLKSNYQQMSFPLSPFWTVGRWMVERREWRCPIWCCAELTLIQQHFLVTNV